MAEDVGHRSTRSSVAVPVIAALLLVVGAAFLVYLLTRTEEPSSGAADPETGSGADAPVAAGSGLDPDEIVEVIPPDGIPAIDDPSFVPVREVDWLSEREPVIALQVGDAARAYPLQIMTWHEIVNDVVSGTPVAVTFCPLCNTAIAFERPRIAGEITTFGTSGKLINSNLLMYDRATESLWPQVTGVALTGPQKGRELTRVPVQIVSWGDFASAHADGDVLSRDTGHDRRYGENPYPGYDEVGKAPFLYSGEVDGRLAAVERVLAIEAGGDAVAFPYFRLRREAQDGVTVVEAEVDHESVVVFWKRGTASALDEADIAASKDVGAATAFSAVLNGEPATFAVAGGKIVDTRTHSVWNIFGRAVEGRLKGQELDPIPATDSFWFDWAAFHPDTELWSP